MAGREEDQQSSLSLAHSSCCTVCSCVIVASLPCRPVGQHCVLDLRCTQPGWAADCQRRGSNLDLFSKPLTANPRGVADRDLSHGKRSRAQPANCKRTQLLTAEGRWRKRLLGCHQVLMLCGQSYCVGRDQDMAEHSKACPPVSWALPPLPPCPLRSFSCPPH